MVFKPYAFFCSDIFHNFVIMQFLFEKFVISLYQTSQHIVESGVKVKWRTNVVRKEDSNYKCLECGANEINDKWPSSKREIPDKLTVKTNEKKIKTKINGKYIFNQFNLVLWFCSQDTDYDQNQLVIWQKEHKVWQHVLEKFSVWETNCCKTKANEAN